MGTYEEQVDSGIKLNITYFFRMKKKEIQFCFFVFFLSLVGTTKEKRLEAKECALWSPGCLVYFVYFSVVQKQRRLLKASAWTS